MDALCSRLRRLEHGAAPPRTNSAMANRRAVRTATHSGAHVDDAGARSLAEGGGAEPDAAQKIFSKVVDCGFIRCSRPKSSSCTSPLTLVICGSGPSLSLGRHCR
jgi:hypothetical protein